MTDEEAKKVIQSMGKMPTAAAIKLSEGADGQCAGHDELRNNRVQHRSYTGKLW